MQKLAPKTPRSNCLPTAKNMLIPSNMQYSFMVIVHILSYYVCKIILSV